MTSFKTAIKKLRSLDENTVWISIEIIQAQAEKLMKGNKKPFR
jgi:hypothetical protein